MTDAERLQLKAEWSAAEDVVDDVSEALVAAVRAHLDFNTIEKVVEEYRKASSVAIYKHSLLLKR
jgi:dsRNA-specific ribonuclease